jgi:hypothetical protein
MKATAEFKIVAKVFDAANVMDLPSTTVDTEALKLNEWGLNLTLSAPPPSVL